MPFQFSKIGLACDHAGKELKHVLVDYVRLLDVEVLDYGIEVDSDRSVDYPDYAALIANAIIQQRIEAGIVVCGTGIGVAMVANKFPTIRAALVWDEFSCRMSRLHNNANVLCLPGRVIHSHRASELVKLWMETPFAGGHHKTRLEKIALLEKENFQAVKNSI